ncbi:MAG: hypothetical protein H0X17_15600 [Deltaproteobacteria bacterium]|nr:hypothetical protein [Deltaproteobacteria bacterium]
MLSLPPRADLLSELLAELRVALWAFLEPSEIPRASGSAGFVVWEPLTQRVYRVLERLETLDAPPDVLATLAAAFRADAVALGQDRFASSPLYPWGIVGHVDSLAERLRYRRLAAGHAGACNCALVIEHDMIDQLQIDGLERTGSSDDPYDPYVDHRCRHCGTEWRRSDHSTEQISASAWTPRPRAG